MFPPQVEDSRMLHARHGLRAVAHHREVQWRETSGGYDVIPDGSGAAKPTTVRLVDREIGPIIVPGHLVYPSVRGGDISRNQGWSGNCRYRNTCYRFRISAVAMPGRYLPVGRWNIPTPPPTADWGGRRSHSSTPKPQKLHSPNLLKRKSISEVERIGIV